ncbi:MAG: PAS domain-containing sensor histidine kinase [Acidobacteria bacterium]|nr:PAS domain-containing sensor histidine kinase [Acidobacteriota bacterium]
MQEHRGRLLALSIVLTLAIAVGDWKVEPNISLGSLYLFPLLLLAGLAPWWQLAAAVAACTYLREALSPEPWVEGVSSRIAFNFFVYFGVSYFFGELLRGRTLLAENLGKLQEQTALRQEAEAEARVLLESVPAAVLTVDVDGRIAHASRTAHRLFAHDAALAGEPVVRFFPMLREVIARPGLRSTLNTMMESRGYRADGSVFFAQMWLSSFAARSGPGLVIVVSDASEHLREREEAGLRDLLRHSRVLAAALSHELRNCSAAAHAVFQSLSVRPQAAGLPELSTLGSLLERLHSLAGDELASSTGRVTSGVDLLAVLDELRIVVTPMFREAGVAVSWQIPPGLPRVRGDHHGLLQVLLNLCNNSERALRDCAVKQVTIVAYETGDALIVRVADSGPGARNGEQMFRPFQSGASGTGLGLFISRAVLRTYGGELYYDVRPQPHFLVELAVAERAGTVIRAAAHR